MRLTPVLVMVCTLLPGGSTVMPVWTAPPVAPPKVATRALPANETAPVSPVPAEIDRRDAAAPLRSDFRRLKLAGPFPAVVTDVIDGDTFEAKVTIWLGHEVTTRVRLLGIDAAEMGSECGEERAMAEVSRAALAKMLGREVDLSNVRFDKYGGRVLARARSASHADVSEAMLAGGDAIHYEGGRRQAWCEPVLTSRK